METISIQFINVKHVYFFKFQGGWIHGVSFSGDGNRICWVGHDSSISVADASRAMAVVKLRTEFLPFNTCTWVGPNSIVVAVSIETVKSSFLLEMQHYLILSFVLQGHNCCPLLYTYDQSGQLSYTCKLDNSQRKEAAGLRFLIFFMNLFSWLIYYLLLSFGY